MAVVHGGIPDMVAFRACTGLAVMPAYSVGPTVSPALNAEVGWRRKRWWWWCHLQGRASGYCGVGGEGVFEELLCLSPEFVCLGEVLDSMVDSSLSLGKLSHS
jgi:hypothetical protein